MVKLLDAEVVALAPDRHDQVVAVVSHVPHLAAATLMTLAADRAEEHAALLRLAAGGFRDMTRIASGHPGDLARHLRREPAGDRRRPRRADRAAAATIRGVVDREDRGALHDTLAQGARRAHQPARAGSPTRRRWPRCGSRSPTAPGAAAELFTLAAELGVNIANFEVVHMAESNRGVAVVLVDAAATDLFRGGLMARGFKPAVTPLV